MLMGVLQNDIHPVEMDEMIVEGDAVGTGDRKDYPTPEPHGPTPVRIIWEKMKTVVGGFFIPDSGSDEEYDEDDELR